MLAAVARTGNAERGKASAITADSSRHELFVASMDPSANDNDPVNEDDDVDDLVIVEKPSPNGWWHRRRRSNHKPMTEASSSSVASRNDGPLFSTTNESHASSPEGQDHVDTTPTATSPPIAVAILSPTPTSIPYARDLTTTATTTSIPPPTIQIMAVVGMAALLKTLWSGGRWWWWDGSKHCNDDETTEKHHDGPAAVAAGNSTAAVELTTSSRTASGAAVEPSSEAVPSKERWAAATVADESPLVWSAVPHNVDRARADVARERERAAYWESLARHHATQLPTAVATERAQATARLRRLREEMLATVEHARAEMLAELQNQISLLRESLSLERTTVETETFTKGEGFPSTTSEKRM